MADWKNTKCGTCIVQRQKPICNSCLGHQFYKPMSNADKIRNMSDEELAEFFHIIDHFWYDDEYLVNFGDDETIHDTKENILDWLQSEVEE